MVDVFISYSRSDLALVENLARAVEAEGYEVWWDAELPPHQSYGDVITAKIEQTKAAIVVWSASAVKSEWVRAEADMARHHRKLVQTAIDDVMPPLPFNQIQYALLGDWRGEPDHPGWRKVKRSLAELCGPRDGGEPTPPLPPPPLSGAIPVPLPDTPPGPIRIPANAQPQAATPQAAARWPLYLGLGVAATGLAVAGGVLLGRQGGAPAPAAVSSDAAPTPAPASTPSPAPSGAAAVAIAEPPAIAGPPLDPDQEAALVPNPADMEFPDSSTRLLTAADVAGKGPTTLRVARNEIYARKGRKFQDPWLREWFGRYAWYRPIHDLVPLNAIERQNVELLQRAEQPYR
jgi:hypothetical protein